MNEMNELASKIGSDCPFFIENKPALISGRGEIVEPLNISLKGLYLVIIYPGFGISTKEAYAMIAPKKPSKSISKIISQPVSSWRDELFNDFETPVFKMYPKLNQIKKTLYQSGALYAAMSGSGSAIYGIFEQRPLLDPLLKKYNVWKGVTSE